MNVLTPEQREIVARLQSGRLMICDGQGDPNSDGCGGQGYTGAAGQEPCPHCYGAGVMTPELRVALASAPSPETGAGGDLVTEDDAEIERIMSLSSDELRAELAAEGHDPDQVLDNAQRGLDGILRLAADRKRWRDEAASWRRVAERLEEEKQALRQSREAL